MSESNIAIPHGAKRHPSLRLVTWHPGGALDAKLAEEILHFIESEEAASSEAFDRFANLDALSAVHLSFADVEEIAARRIECYRSTPVKSAILAVNPLAFGMARMYERLMVRSSIEVRAFCRLTSAAAWLNKPIEVLATS
jgi:hypothetical protein